MVSLFVLNMLGTTIALAQGVIAGTEISNIAIVNYSVEGESQVPIESSPSGNSTPSLGNGVATIFKVDRKIDLLVTGNNNANVTPGDFQSEVTFSLLNEGNDTQNFQLTPNGTLTADIFDTSSCTTTITAVSGTPLAGVILPSTGSIKLSPDQQASISVKCDIPLNNGGSPISTGDTSFVSLLVVTQNIDTSAITESNTADAEELVETVFVDSMGTDDADKDAKHSARRTYTATTSSIPPTLSINKTILEVKDPSGGNTAITGSEVSYKITVSSQGVGVIDNVVISDTSPAEMTYKPESIVLDGTSLTDDNVDSDEANFGFSAVNTATINLGSITAGSQYEILLTYVIN